LLHPSTSSPVSRLIHRRRSNCLPIDRRHQPTHQPTRQPSKQWLLIRGAYAASDGKEGHAETDPLPRYLPPGCQLTSARRPCLARLQYVLFSRACVPLSHGRPRRRRQQQLRRIRIRIRIRRHTRSSGPGQRSVTSRIRAGFGRCLCRAVPLLTLRRHTRCGGWCWSSEGSLAAVASMTNNTDDNPANQQQQRGKECCSVVVERCARQQNSGWRSHLGRATIHPRIRGGTSSCCHGGHDTAGARNDSHCVTGTDLLHPKVRRAPSAPTHPRWFETIITTTALRRQDRK
jgi:hypothetical protein